jgi:uncharacterized protein (DUF305 family)
MRIHQTICGLIALASFAAIPALSVAQSAELAKSRGSSELHRIMMSSAKESQSMKPSGDVDHDFLTMMRHHHQSGIKMAEVEMRQGKSAEAKEMARKIIEAQKKEIAEIDTLLKNYPSSAEGSSGHSGSSGHK